MKYPSTRFVFDRKHTASKTVKALVQVEVLYDRKKKYISTGVKVYKNQFDPKKRIICNTFDMVALNDKMNAVKSRVDNYITSCIRDGIEFTFNGLQNNLDSCAVKEMSFIEYVEKRIDERTDIRDTTKKTHRKVITLLKEFGIIKWFSDLTKQNVMLLDDYLHKKGLKQATVHSYHKMILTYINDAIKREYLDKNPYQTLTIDKGYSIVGKFLTDEEVESIKDAKMPTESIGRVRDLFILQCYTGLAYSDLMTVDFTKLNKEGDVYFINGNRVKTGISYCAALLPDALEIIDKYNGKLPKMSNQQFNIRLKIVAEAAGVNKPISSHWGRHTCGMLLLNKGVSMEVVSKVLGHASISTTEKIYAKILDKTVVKEVIGKML